MFVALSGSLYQTFFIAFLQNMQVSERERLFYVMNQTEYMVLALDCLDQSTVSVINITPPIFISQKISRYLFLVLVNLGGQANEKIFAPRRGITSVARDFIDLVIVIDSCQDICHRYKTHTWLSVVHPYLRQLVVQALTQHREEAGASHRQTLIG